MELKDYVCLLPEQKITLIQRDLKKAARDLALWQAAQNIGMAGVFREVNSFWRRPAWRSVEDYALVEAVLLNHEAEQGHLEQALSPQDVLGLRLDKLHDTLDEAMAGVAQNNEKPARGDAEALRAFWNEYASWRHISEPEKREQMAALMLFWDKDALYDVMYKEAYRDQVLMQEHNVINEKAEKMKQAVLSLVDYVPFLDARINAVKNFYHDYQGFFARLYDKSDAEKTAMLNKEKLRLTKMAMIEKAEASLRPEGRHYNLKRQYALREGVYVAPEWVEPQTVSLPQKAHADIAAFMHKHGIDKAWNKLGDKTRDAVRQVNWAHLNPFRAKTLFGKSASGKDGAGKSGENKNGADKKASAKKPLSFGRMIKNTGAFIRRNKTVSGLVLAAVTLSFFSNRFSENENHTQETGTPHYKFHFNSSKSDPFKNKDNEAERSYEHEAIRARVLQEYLNDSLEKVPQNTPYLDESDQDQEYAPEAEKLNGQDDLGRSAAENGADISVDIGAYIAQQKNAQMIAFYRPV